MSVDKVTRVDNIWLEKLACPRTRCRLVQVDDWLYATDPESRYRYPIRDGIPILLIDESEEVTKEEYERVMQLANQTQDEADCG